MRQGRAGYVMAGRGRLGELWSGQVSHGGVRNGLAGRGMAGGVRYGVARFGVLRNGKVRYGKAGEARFGKVRKVEVWQGVARYATKKRRFKNWFISGDFTSITLILMWWVG